MLEASFDRKRTASISGAYQYDTGQRVALHGLPTPQELAEMDDFLSGDVVTVQAHFGYMSDVQTEPRLALYDEAAGVWLVDVPDAYLTRSEPVHLYVYVSYGADGEHSRAKTMYTGSFTPISRPSPNNVVTPDQLNAWDALVAEVNLTLAEMNTAISNANAAATSAGEAGSSASSAASRANAVSEDWENATVTATTLPEGSSATVSLTDGAQGKHIAFGIPRGATGPAGVTFRLDGTTLYITTD